jgi:hypothetical protein
MEIKEKHEDNKKKAGTACNADQTNADKPVEIPTPTEEKLVDELLRFIYTDTATLNKWRQLDPKGAIPPHEREEVLAYGKSRFEKKAATAL